MEPNLDPYPLPSNIHVSSCVTVKLTDQNYSLWKPQIEALLSSQKLIGFVNGKEVTPPSTITVRDGSTTSEISNPKFEAWVCTDQLVKTWIFGTLSEEVLGYVVGFQYSRDIWSFLSENFNKSSISRVFELRRCLQLISKKGKTFADYCKEFRGICDQLSSIGEPVEESMKIFNFLNGLGRDYDPISAVIQNSLSRHPPPTFNDVVSEVGAFDKRLQSYEDQPTITPHLAFQSQMTNYSSQQNFQYGSRGRGGSNSRFGSNRGRGGYSSRGRGFSQQVSSHGSSNLSSRPVCQICGRTGHTAIKCYNRFDKNYQSEDFPQALAAIQLSDPSGNEWYPDSGASAHITPNISSLQNITPYNGSENVMVADGDSLPITHVGSTNLTSTAGLHSGSSNTQGPDSRKKA